jgi:triosephosphate isomerase
MTRRPMALANWKMAMKVAESLSFVEELERELGGLPAELDVVICPAFTALAPLAQKMGGSSIQLGGQNMAPSADLARTGEISAPLLADAGCTWVMLGHWEVRRHLGDDDAVVNRKLHLALEAGLRPILFIGEAREESTLRRQGLQSRLETMLGAAAAEQAAQMAFVYEPESAIGTAAPSTLEQVAAGTATIRGWLRHRWGDAAERARIVYGGSVAPEHAASLLACPELDGLGATRRGRDAAVFAEIVRHIARAKL